MKQARLYEFYLGTNAERTSSAYFPIIKDGVMFYERDTGARYIAQDNDWVEVAGGGIPEPLDNSLPYARTTVAGVSSWVEVVPKTGGQYTGNVGIKMAPTVELHVNGKARVGSSASERFVEYYADGSGTNMISWHGTAFGLLSIWGSSFALYAGTVASPTNLITGTKSGSNGQLKFFGGTPVSKPTSVTARAALESLGLGASLTFEGIPEPLNNSLLYARTTVAGVSSWVEVVPKAGGQYTGNVGFGIAPAYPLHTLGEVRHEYSTGAYLHINNTGTQSQISARDSSGNLALLLMQANEFALAAGTGASGTLGIHLRDVAGQMRLGFYGTTPVARPSGVSPATALNALGLGTGIVDAGGIADALSNGFMYVRRNGAWVSGGFAFAESVTVGDGTNYRTLRIDGGAGNERDLIFMSGTVNRWILRANSSAESGSDAGSDLELMNRSDAGVILSRPIFIRRSNGYIGLVNNLSPEAPVHILGNTFIDGTARVRQVGSTRYRSDWTVSSGAVYMNAYDDTATAYLPMTFYVNGLTFVNQQGGNLVATFRSSSSTTPYIQFTNPAGGTRYGYLQGLSTAMWLASDTGLVVLHPQTGNNTRVQFIVHTDVTPDVPAVQFINSSGTNVFQITANHVTFTGVAYVDNASIGHVFVSNGSVQARIGFGGASGVTIGPAGSGALGLGWVNVSGGVARNGGAYTHPGFVFEKEYAGKIERFRSELSDLYKGMPSLEDLENQFRTDHRIWLRPKSDKQELDIFAHAEVLEANIEILYLHILKLHRMIKELI